MFGHGQGRYRTLTTEPQKAKNIGVTLKRLMRYLKPSAGKIFSISLLVIASTLFTVIAPRLIGTAVDILWNFFRGNVSASSAAFILTKNMLILLALYIGIWITNAGSYFLMAIVGQSVLYDLRRDIFNKIQVLSLSFFDGHETGDIMSRLTNDTEVINRVIGHGIMRFFSSVLTVIGILIAMLLYNPRLALVSFAIIPFMIISTVFFAKRARKAFRRTRKTIGKVSAELEENIAGVKVSQAFSRQKENIASFKSVNEANRSANITAESITAAFSPTLDVLSTIGIAIVLGYGGYLALNNLITVGVIVAFLQYMRRFFHPVQAISVIWASIQSAIAGAERIFELIDDPACLKDEDKAKSMPVLKGRVEFKDVCFEYIKGEPVLKKINFTAEPGKTIAIVGPTGAGKTTLLSLIGRFYDADSGSVLIDSFNVRNITRKSIREQTGVVLQDTFLFSDTIMDNIRYGRIDAADEQVINAATLANANNFIMSMPEGYSTEITEGASNLSKGQRQLLAIARAILADPRILILDEATSSVDTQTEKLIQQALIKLLKGRTSFVVAHRLSTIINADLLLVLDNGEIVERGTHKELMNSRGTYYNIYMSQFADSSGSETN